MITITTANILSSKVMAFLLYCEMSSFIMALITLRKSTVVSNKKHTIPELVNPQQIPLPKLSRVSIFIDNLFYVFYIIF